MTRVLVHNPGSGPAGIEVPEQHFDGFEMIPIERAVEDLTAARDAGALELVAVWGGDGTMRSVAGVLVGTDIAMLPCPGGTKNHFAVDLGVADVETVAQTLTGGVVRRVDVGMAGEQVFLNNANAGWYVDLVARRERLERRMPRKLAKALSVVLQIGRTRRLRVEFDGEVTNVWMIWIGNGEFSLDPKRLAERDDPADGLLDVRLLRAEGRLPKLRALASIMVLAARNRDPVDSPHLERRLVRHCTFRFRRETVRFALDGELERLRSPVPFSCGRQALQVLVPAPQAGLATATDG